MAILRRIFVIHTTADTNVSANADTDATFDLVASRPETDFIAPFPDHPHDERESDRTDEYEFNVEGENIDSDTTRLTMIMRSTSDGWLPRSVWALGETNQNQIIILGAHPEWQNGWFDRGRNPVGPDRHLISN